MILKIKSTDLKAFALGLAVMPVNFINNFKPQGTFLAGFLVNA
jgi:hypothetical protein